MRAAIKAAIVATTIALAGCAGLPKDAFTPSASVVKIRSEQTRRYNGIAKSDILAASAGVLQDLGFTLNESQEKLGVLVATKERSARSAGQIALAVLAAALSGVMTPTDKDQTFYLTLVVSPVDQVKSVTLAKTTNLAPNTVKGDYLVRATFAHIVRNTQDQVTEAAQLRDDKLYREFFSKLSKSVFLEGQKI
jgi:hypothetical protein